MRPDSRDWSLPFSVTTEQGLADLRKHIEALADN